jgi:hypothetical protein
VVALYYCGEFHLDEGCLFMKFMYSLILTAIKVQINIISTSWRRHSIHRTI